MKKILIIILLLVNFINCNSKKDTRLKYKIVAMEQEKFEPMVDEFLELLKRKNYKLINSNKFQGSFNQNASLLYKKGIDLKPPKGQKGYLNLKFYFIESLESCQGSINLFFNEVKDYKNKETEQSVFAIFNNYNVIVLTFVCKNESNEEFAREVIPLLYKTFKKSDSKIMNVECGSSLKYDAELY